jgi:glycine dehydrogenase subunit 1
VRLPRPAIDMGEALLAKGVVGGYAVDELADPDGGAMLLCATEKRSKVEIDAFVEALKEVCHVR